jgi:hypothetical protein
MPIELNIKITSPMTPDDRDLLSGIAVMTLAIANREMAENRFPDTFVTDEEEDGETPIREVPEAPQPETYTAGQARPCGFSDGMTICVSPMGHRGRHKMRVQMEGLN